MYSAISEYIISASANSELKFCLKHFQNVWESWPAASGYNMVTLTQELSAFCNWQGKESEAETGWESLDPGLLPIGGLHISNFNCLTECSDMKILGKQFYNLYLKKHSPKKQNFMK